MDLNEFFGLIVWLIAAIFFFAKKIWGKKERHFYSEKISNEQKKGPQSSHRGAEPGDKPRGLSAKKDPLKPLVAKLPVKKAFPDQPFSIDLKELYYPIYTKQAASRAQKLVRRASSTKEMVLYHEILKTPKGYERY